MKRSIARMIVIVMMLAAVMIGGTVVASAETKEASDWFTLHAAIDDGGHATGDINVVLTDDIKAIPLLHVIRVPEGAKATIDMNGHSIYGVDEDYNYIDIEGEVNVINSKDTVSTFDNFSDYVFTLQEGAKLTINSGVKLCNNCRGIGETPIHTKGDVTLDGCEISGNSVADDDENTMGAAVVVDKAGTLTLKGDFKFADNLTTNKKSGEKYNCDVLLISPTAKIVLPEELTKKETPIVVGSRFDTTFTTGWKEFNNGKDPAEFFKASKTNGTISLDEATGELSYSIKKVANTLSVKAKSYTVKYKTLKKKTQTIARKKVLTVSGAKGTVTYTKSSGNKKITVAKKTGNITLKKGLKKGTYKVKVSVKAAGTADYEAKTIKKTVTIKVK